MKIVGGSMIHLTSEVWIPVRGLMLRSWLTKGDPCIPSPYTPFPPAGKSSRPLSECPCPSRCLRKPRHFLGLPSDSCRWSQAPRPSGGGPALSRPLGGWLSLPVSFPLFLSLLCGLPQHPNPPSASEVKACQTWRRLPGFSQVLALTKESKLQKWKFSN